MAKIVTVYCDNNGRSAAVETSLPQVFPASPLYQDAAESWCVITGTRGDFGDWHTVTSPLLSIVLTGEWEVETECGAKFLMKPGDMLFAADTTGKGHRSRVVSPVPCTVAGIGLKSLPASLCSLLPG
ncbi:hypothetical protein Q4520_06990 [Alteromonas sp. 1_MG-2023]|uniref:hypothetical protein n=1 Tax=Alteromonas sp. 1_MG-2023 TaxID=3062669 RepID=UPI0026E144F8|nr:hypothetical protein [Alteromonas sp. 1_MG-2023]MDO6475157.1 hypothetical protein [Alteromonas sp. 1_MG-2023]